MPRRGDTLTGPRGPGPAITRSAEFRARSQRQAMPETEREDYFATCSPGAIIEREESVAKKIGHDPALTNSDVDRSRLARRADTTSTDAGARRAILPAAVSAL